MNYHGKRLEVKRVLVALGMRISATTKDEYYACCPFHTDKNPSFAISRQTGLWICHTGCGSGNITQLWHMMTGDDMLLSMRHLMQLSTSYSQSELLALTQNDSCDFQPAKVYKQMHLENYDPSIIPPYWQVNRGFNEEFSKEWDIGYDKVLDAVVMPVCDPWGMVVGATRRLIHPTDEQNKYHHDHGTPRNSVLFGLHKTGNSKLLILTEGPTSCLRLHQYGHTNAVAIFGTSMSSSQIRLLLQRVNTVTLFFDNDDAGIKATDKIAMQLHDKMAVFIAKYPRGTEGNDPAELLPAQVRYALSYADFYFFWLMQKYG